LYERTPSIAIEATRAYWTLITSESADVVGSPFPGTPAAPVDAVSTEALALAREASDLDAVEAAFLLGSAHAAALPCQQRAAQGAFYTPSRLVDRLLDLLECAGADWTRHRVLDPAAGSGVFTVAVAERIASTLARHGASPPEVEAAIASRVRGIEVDPVAAWIANVVLTGVLARHGRSPTRGLVSQVKVRDALRIPDTWFGSADVVVGNPPYGRVTDAPELRARFGRSLFGHANYYGLFTDLAIRLVNEAGLVGFVTPASFLGGHYYKRLRALIRAEAPPQAIEFVEARSGVFEGVLQETVLTVLRRGSQQQHVQVSVSNVSSSLEGKAGTVVGVTGLPGERSDPWVLPRAATDSVLIASAATMAFRLADYGFRVSTGPLVWNRHKAQLREQSARGTLPIIWAESVLPNGRFAFSAARRNHKPRIALTHSQSHLIERTPCVLVQRTTAKEQTRRLIAALLPRDFLEEEGGAVVENHLNVVRNGAPAAAQCSGVLRGDVGLQVIEAILNSSVVDRLFRCINGSVAVSAYEIASLPFPSPDGMVTIQKGIERGGERAEVDRIITSVYSGETIAR
jgi:adenine-specific DNA-methyltransferase